MSVQDVAYSDIVMQLPESLQTFQGHPQAKEEL